MSQKLEQRKTRRGWETRGRWKFSGKAAALVLAAAGTGMMAAPARAQKHGPAIEASVPAESGEPQAQSLPHSFNIPASPLTDALEAYRHAAHVRLHIHLPPDQMAGFRSKGVQGTYPNDIALTHLLEGTGLSSSPAADGGMVIELRRTESVDVSDSVNSVALQQFTEPLLDTAQTVNTVPQYILQEQGAVNMRDGLRNVPGISLAAGENGAQGDNLTVRGFSARNDIFLDGIRDFGSYYRDAFDYESIDVLQGPAGVEFGRGSTGGVINQETKTPGLHPHITGTLQLGTDAMRRVTADINEPLEQIPGGSALRVNLMGMQTNVAERDYANINRYGIAPSLAFGLNTHTRAFIEYLHEAENSTPDYGLPYFGVTPAPVSRNVFYGFANDSVLKTTPDILTGKVERDLPHGALLRNQLRFGNYPRVWRIVEPQINSTPVYRVSGVVTAGQLVSGTVTATCDPTLPAASACYPANADPGSVQVKRNILNGTSTEDSLWDQVSVLGHLNFLHIDNNFVVIAEGGRERSRPQRATYPATYAPMLNPNANDPFPAPTALAARTYVTTQSFGVGFNDTLKLREWLLLAGGVRYDYFDTSSATAGTPTQFHTDKMPDYRASIVVKPRPQGSVYFDWGTSFNPAAESLSLSANNATQNPQTNETYEGGVKWSFLRDRLNVNSAYFQTTKDNVYETDPNNSNNVIPVGDQRVRGAQFGAIGHMPQHFDLILGYAYLDGRIIGSIQNYSPFASVSAFVNGSATAQTVKLYIPGDPVYGARQFYLQAQGNPFANVPKNSFNAWVTHAIRWGVVGGFGVNQVSARRASSTAPNVIPNTAAPTLVQNVPIAFKVMPGYWNFNAMLSKSISDRLSAQVNVNNLTNAFFIDQPHPSHLIPGEGINAQFGLNYKF